jgi:hypothetical protein
MATACFRLFTVRPEPLFSVPFFRLCIADLTLFDADLPYFATGFLLSRSNWRSEPGTPLSCWNC